MAKCQDCNQEMLTADSCIWTHVEIDGKVYKRDTYNFDEPGGRCNDCGAKHGQTHHFGCDVERYPRCGMQFIGCDCIAGDELRLVRYDVKEN